MKALSRFLMITGILIGISTPSQARKSEDRVFQNYGAQYIGLATVTSSASFVWKDRLEVDVMVSKSGKAAWMYLISPAFTQGRPAPHDSLTFHFTNSNRFRAYKITDADETGTFRMTDAHHRKFRFDAPIVYEGSPGRLSGTGRLKGRYHQRILTIQFMVVTESKGLIYSAVAEGAWRRKY